MKEFKYKWVASSQVKPVLSEEKDKYLAKASLDSLKPILPNVDLIKNHDLLVVAFNAFVAGRFNKNDDGANAKTSVEIADLFISKQVNIEHNRQRVVGYIVTAGFSEFGSNTVITREEALASNKPFNVTLGAIIWRVVNPELAEFIEESGDPSSEHYEKVSASWEIGFNDYDIVKISNGSRNIEDGAIISDPEKFDELEGKLRAFGGDGLFEGGKLYRLVKGRVLPLGIGLTETPAAEVKGLLAKEADNQALQQDKQPEIPAEVVTTSTTTSMTVGPIVIQNASELILANSETVTISTKNENNFSHPVETHVKRNDKIMKLNSLNDLTEESLKEVSLANIRDAVAEEIKKASEAWVAEKTNLETAKANAELAQSKAQESLNTLTRELDEVRAELKKFQEEQVAALRIQKFSERMASLDEKFELTDEDRGVISSKVKDMDDAAFAAYEKEMSVLLKGKLKGLKEAKASESVKPQEVLEEALENSKQATAEIPVTTQPNKPTLREKYAKAFSPDKFQFTK